MATDRQFGFNLVDPAHYAKHGYPHDTWTKLRAEDPVYRWTETEGMPFWAITKHADVTEISKQPDIFLNGPRLTISHLAEEPRMDAFPDTLIQMDNPKHRAFRKMISSRFTPRALKKIHGPIEQIGKEIVDALIVDKEEGEVDFVEAVSAPLPIAVIGWLLGVPKSDWPLLFDWTNKIIGASDPDFQQQGKDVMESAQSTMIELFTYFSKLVEEKRKKPDDNLVSLFTQLEFEGKPLDPMDVLAWCLIIVVAGNETTRNATSGGMLAFVENPGEIRKLQSDPSLLSASVEEAVRWTSPIIHFARTPTRDYELRGKTIKKDESVALFYGSANRDEEVWEDPFTFRIDRGKNPHLGFGIGEHFCVGSHLARLEMAVAYKHLLPRIEEIELAGPVERLQSALVGGVKKLPIRYKLRPA
ncbi:MAG: cytochrome P450 [Deltaproteobacteria bacterium]|nr:cytochrome P450 [Deltaproteobacteria bacterium]MBW2444832.1 cytochrome P450 [Deltaproteobacteria bacterium]